jgi:hypothetical protein
MCYTQDVANMTGITRGEPLSSAEQLQNALHPPIYTGQTPHGSSDRYHYPQVQSPSPVCQEGYIQLQQHPSQMRTAHRERPAHY